MAIEDEQGPVSVDYALFERLVGEQCTEPAEEFPPGDVLLPESPLSISSLLLEATGVNLVGRSPYEDFSALETDFRYHVAERVASFDFWSDGVEMYRYHLRDGRVLVIWSTESFPFVGVALLRDAGVFPVFFEEFIASCGDLGHVIGWGSLPRETSVTVSPEMLLRAAFRFLMYADNGEAWNYYARLGRAGRMPVAVPGPMPSWVRQQDTGYWTEADEFVKGTIGYE